MQIGGSWVLALLIVTGCSKGEKSAPVADVACSPDGSCPVDFTCKSEICVRVKSEAELRRMVQTFQRLEGKIDRAQEEINTAQKELDRAIETEVAGEKQAEKIASAKAKLQSKKDLMRQLEAEVDRMGLLD